MKYKYNIDGSQRPETEAERREREAKIVNIQISSSEAMERAKNMISGVDPSSVNDHTERIKLLDLPWSRKVDWLLFSKDGEAGFSRHEEKYQDFKTFYIKYKNLHMRKSGLSNLSEADEIEVARLALTLFKDFLQKKEVAVKDKIKKLRNSLPIKDLQHTIVSIIRENQVVLIAADTGAGKSTQVPQYLLEAGFDKIACTQPRRIACYSLAKRVGYESANTSDIGYKVRFGGSRTKDTKVLFLTEGVLLREYVSDPRLSAYNVIIVDEVHERHVTGDFLLGILKKIVSERNDLKIVLMSATINSELFSAYFNAPVIQVPGRTYPVQIEYIPFEKEDPNLVEENAYKQRMDAEVKLSVSVRSEKIKSGPYLRIMEKIDHSISSSERGDLLIFLSGINEISILAEELQEYANMNKRWIILILHSTLSAGEQEKVFDVAPQGVRKCILSTNLAETSVTIDGIRFIIDSGKVKEMAFDPASRLSRLQEFWISSSSAKQRAGRAGRTGPGICYRLYSQNEFEHFNSFPVPEIQRTCLDPLVLQIKAYNLGDPRFFDFIEKPFTQAIEQSLLRLQDLGCIDSRENITSLGNVLALLPVDLVLGKMLVLGQVCHIKEPMLVVAAALSVSSPFVRIPESQTDILNNRQELFSDHGDPFTYLNVYSSWLRVKVEKGSSSRWCQRHGIEEQRLYELVKLKEQFESILKNSLDSKEGGEEASNKRVRQPQTERDYWTDPEYKKKREQRFLLSHQKHAQSSSRRKLLKVNHSYSAAEQDEENEEPSVNELEFSLKHNPEDLLNKSDILALSIKEINLIKLLICSGLYPNIAIADEANYYRKLNEQAFHTSSKRFLSMHPTSVFSFRPEIIQPLPPEDPMDFNGKETLKTIRGSVRNQENLCYLQLLETNKPYLLNVFRSHGLHTCLLFSRTIDISPDMTHLIIDNWLHLHIFDSLDAQKVLIVSSWLRNVWQVAIDHHLKKTQKLQTHEVVSNNEIHIINGLELLPATLRRIYREYCGIMRGESESMENVDISARLSDFLDISVDCNLEKLKMSEIESWFGYDPYQSTTRSFKITTFFRYFPEMKLAMMPELDFGKMALQAGMNSDVDAPDDVTMCFQGVPEEKEEKINSAPRPDSKLFSCQSCHEIFDFTPIEALKHKRMCKKD